MAIDIKKYYREPFFRNSIAILSTTAIGSIFGLVFWIIAARTIQAVEIGMATAAISTAGLLSVMARLGMDTGLIRYLPGEANKNGLYGTAMTIAALSSVIFGMAFLLIVDYVSPALGYLRSGVYPFVFTAFVAATSLMFMQNNAMIALRRADLSLCQNVLLSLRIPILLLASGLGVLGIISSFGLAYAITILFGIFILYRFGISIKPGIDLRMLRNIIGYSLGNYSAGIILSLPAMLVPVLIIGVLGPAECAYFYIAYSIGSILFAVPGAAATSLFVEGSHDYPLRRHVYGSLKFIAITLVPAIAVILLFGDKALLVFSREYSESSFELLRLFAVSAIFMPVPLIYTGIKRVQKNIRIINYLNLFTAISVIALSIVFMAAFGLIGVGYAWLVSYMALCVIIGALVAFHDKWRLPGLAELAGDLVDPIR